MPVNTTDLMQNIYDLFTGIYAASNGAGAALAFERLGVPISTSMFRINPADTALSPALAVERLSEIAGAVMQLQGGSVYRSNRTVEAVTELMLGQSMPATPEVMAALGAARTADNQRFDVSLGSLEGDFRFHPSYASPPDWYDPAAAIWTPHKVDEHAAGLSATQGGGSPTRQAPVPSPAPPPVPAPVPPPVPPVAAHPPVMMGPLLWHVVAAEARPALQASGPRESAMIAMAQAKPPGAAAATMHAPAMHAPAMVVAHAPIVPHAPVTAHPPVAVHPPMTMIAHLPPKPPGAVVAVHPTGKPSLPVAAAVHPPIMVMHPAAFAATSAMQLRPLLVAQAAAQVSAAATTRQVSTSSLDISFEHCVVTLNRPWFPQTFTMLRDWFLPGYGRGAISTGKADGDTGLMPLLPSGFVAVRNLVITAQWSEADLATVQGSASFGPFSLLGRSFDAKTGTLSAPGMQIIGWFCEALPVLPPLSDPALAAAVPPVDVPRRRSAGVPPAGVPRWAFPRRAFPRGHFPASVGVPAPPAASPAPPGGPAGSRGRPVMTDGPAPSRRGNFARTSRIPLHGEQR